MLTWPYVSTVPPVSARTYAVAIDVGSSAAMGDGGRLGKAKRVRLARERQKTLLKMSVVNSNREQTNDALELTSEVQQCHAALLYADEVKLISPRATMLKSALDFSLLQGAELVQACANLAGVIKPENAEAAQLMSAFAAIPSSSLAFMGMEDQHRELLDRLISGLDPFIESFQPQVEQLLRQSGFDRLRKAIDKGILTIVDLDGTGVTDVDRRDPMVNAFIARIQEVLQADNEYPLFDSFGNDLVRQGIAEGFFTPVPMARRLGRDAAMAQGLFDRLPNFPLASTDEILDIREKLQRPLSKFRSGVRELTTSLEVGPESDAFGGEIEDAWNLKVAPALDEIEEAVNADSTLRDLARRYIDEPTGLGSAVSAATLASSLAVAAGPVVDLPSAAALAVTTSVAAMRAYRTQSQALREVTETQFYFLYGADARMGLIH